MDGRGHRRVVFLDGIAANYAWAVRWHPAGVAVVLKDDAYGHGLVPVVLSLQDAGARHVFVATLAEADRVRRAGLKQALTVLRPPLDLADCEEFRRLDAVPTARSPEDVALITRYGRFARVDVEVDAGLGRGGFAVADLAATLERLAGRAGVVDVGFQAPATLDAAGVATLVRHLVDLAPAATVRVGGSALLGAPVPAPVRAGRLLFGIVPSGMRALGPPLRPAGAWLAAVRRITAGPTIGYDTASAGIGADHYELDLGYADGLPSRAVGWDVAVGERLLRLVAVFMDRSVAVDRTGGPLVDGAEALVVGSHPDHRARPVRDFADHLGCSPSEAIVLPRAAPTHTGHAVCLFDLDGVLRHWDPLVAAQVDRDTGHPPGTFNRIAFQLPEYHAAMVGKAGFDDWCAAIERRLSERADQVRVAAAVAAWRRHRGAVAPDVLALLREVRRHVRVAILSNAHDCLPADLAALGIDTEVDAVFGSANLTLAKPDPALFNSVTDALGVAPYQCFFVDDLQDNVAAACRAGWDAVLFRTTARLRAELRLRGLCG